MSFYSPCHVPCEGLHPMPSAVTYHEPCVIQCPDLVHETDSPPGVTIFPGPTLRTLSHYSVVGPSAPRGMDQAYGPNMCLGSEGCMSCFD